MHKKSIFSFCRKALYMWRWIQRNHSALLTGLILQKCEKARSSIVAISHCIDRAGEGTKGTAGYYSLASTMKMSGGKSGCIDGLSVNLTFGWRLKKKHLFLAPTGALHSTMAAESVGQHHTSFLPND